MNVSATGADPDRPRVLVVDDDRALRTLAGEALGAAGFSVVTAADGEAALGLLETSRPDLILLDVLLPGVDGISLCRQVRAAPETRDTPICIMTGLDDRASIQLAFEAGASDFVVKPPSWPILVQHLRYLLRSCQVARELAAANARLQREMSERERTAAALLESEERLRLALMAADQGLYDFNIQTGRTVVSPEYARMLGYEPDELAETNQKFRQRLHDEDRAGVWRAFSEHLSGARGEFRAEFRQRTKSGEWKWILSLGRVVARDGEGRPLRMLGTHTDITERKKDEAELRKLSQAVEQGGNGIIMTDLEGRIEYANPRFLEITGYALPEVLGQNPRILKSGEQDAGFYAGLWATITAGRVWRGVMRNRRKDGALYWDETTIAPIRDEAGRLISYLAVKEDVTERKRLEESERDQRRLAEALRDSAAALSGTLRLESVLDKVLDCVGAIAAYDSVTVVMIEGREAGIVRQRCEPHAAAGTSGVGRLHRVEEFPLLVPILETRRPCFQTEVTENPRCAPGCRLARQTRSCLGLPLAIRGEVVGAIILTSAAPGFFADESARRLMPFAHQASLAIENARLFEKAHRLSVTDELTGLSNRRFFFEAGKVEYERTLRHGRALSAAMIDIDQFKLVNDARGHLVGDEVLREVARRIKSTVRAMDIVARFGGEEFVVLMPETDLAEALQVAERVRRCVAETPVADEGAAVSATVSVGVAENSEECAGLEELLRCSDQALYAAKESGRNRVTAWRRGG